ncbi:MAG: DNA polymerase IV (family X) [halophilic archaeon J07HX5]|nr:MAG: DNA polymerase IV (family X) [halophilic archaeon J07HX5]
MSQTREVAARLEEFADLLAATDVAYKPRVYRRAAENIRDHPDPIEDLAADGHDRVATIDAVGDAIAAKIIEYIETDSIDELDELRSELPVKMDALTSVEGVGPKTVGRLYDALGIQTLDDLETAATNGKIREIDGFGAKTEQNIREGITFARDATERQLLGEARPLGERVVAHLSESPSVKRCALAGSIRRFEPTIGDIDVLAASEEPEAAVAAFTDWSAAGTVLEAGSEKASLRAAGMQVDLRVVAPAEFGAAQQYFTGSKAHNLTVRNRAIDRGLKLNEYGVFDVSETTAEDQRAGERLASESEAEVYEAVGLSWIPPELREDRGEVAAAAADDLPTRLAPEHIRGDLHVHTNWSDGGMSIETMVAAAADRGHEYICLTDHATGPGMVGGIGLDDDALREQLQTIRTVADDATITVFAGVEANIAPDGSVSVGDDLLADLDLVVASPHASLSGDGTDRLLQAARHPSVDIIGHPTGRQLQQRSGLDIDIERLATAAAEHGTALETNASPRRLDLSGRQIKTAVDAGASIAVNTDAHRPASLDLRRFGVHTARRGWAEPADVVNAQPAGALRSFLE